MPKRMFNILSVLAGLNLIVCIACYSSLTNDPSAGPEGLGTAIVAFLSVIFSVLLAGLALNQILAELRHGAVTWRPMLVTLLAPGCASALQRFTASTVHRFTDLTI